MIKRIFFTLLLAVSTQATTVAVGDLVLSVTSSNTAVLMLQLEATDDLDGEWEDVGSPVRWEIHLDNGVEFFKVQASGEDPMINSILKLSGVETNPVECPRVDDVNGKAAWQGQSGDNIYTISSLASAYKTASTGAVPAGLQGDVYWYDTGTTENDEAVYYDASNTYAKWTHASDGVVFTVVDDVGETTPTGYFKLQDYPDTITVSGTGTAIDGAVPFYGLSQYDKYEYRTASIFFNSSVDPEWEAELQGVETWTVESASFIPPKTGWSVGNEGSPAPTLTYTIPTDQYVGQGTWSGTLTLSADVTDSTWAITGSLFQLVNDDGTYPPADFGGGVTTELGQVITLDLQGGTGETYINTFGGTYGTFPTITRYSYIFAGWFTEREGTGTRAYDDDSLIVPNDDDTLYVKWVSSISGEVSCGQSMLSHFAISVGTDLFAAPLTARKTRAESVQAVLPIPPGAS